MVDHKHRAMAKARSKDPLLAATTSILLPVVKPYGFQRYGSRKLARICDDVLHIIGPSYSGWGGRDFYIEICALGLTPPTDGIDLTWGARLRDEMTGYDSWPGQTHELAYASMERVVQLMYKRVLPSYFQRLETMEDYLGLLQRRDDPDHHTRFERACCLVKLQRLDEARRELTAAVWQYFEDGRSWCFPKAAQCDKMLKAISEGGSLELYERWKVETIRNLRLEKIIPNEIVVLQNSCRQPSPRPAGRDLTGP